MDLFDVVTLVEDRPDLGLTAGAQGTIVDVYEEPTSAFEVEFNNAEGEMLALAALEPNQIRPA